MFFFVHGNLNYSFKCKIVKNIVVFCSLMFPISAYAALKPAAALINDLGKIPILVQSTSTATNSILLEYQVPPPQFEAIDYQVFSSRPVQRCFIGNALTHTTPGQPEVPLIYSRIVLPPGRIIDEIRVIPKKEITLPGSYTLSYAATPTPLSSPTPTPTLPDMAIYESDNMFPGKAFELLSIQYRCGIPIAEIDIYPLRYYPESGKIIYYQEFTLEVTTKMEASCGTDLVPQPERFFDEYTMTEDNPEMLEEYMNQSGYRGMYAENYDWIVISEDSIVSASTTPNLQSLVDFRKNKGLTARSVPMSEVRRQSGANDREKLRNFIKYAWNTWKTKWVLLAGDVNIIPLWTVAASNGGTSDNLPSDMPYQCLDQATWNNDYAAEVYIGRFSGQNKNEIANQIFKTIAYESDADNQSYFFTGLSLGEKLNSTTFATTAMNQLESLFPIAWKYDSLYDRSSYSWAKSQLITLINSDRFSVINHLGHSNFDYAFKLRNGDEAQFKNKNFPFVKSQGCIPGAFDKDCFAERITTQTRTGMFAAVMNSRYGWYSNNTLNGSSHIVHRTFWEACWKQNMNYFGEFNEYSHRINTRYRWDILESNLFGDPAVKFRGREAAKSIQVSSPNGGEQWEAGNSFTITWDDNISENVKIELLKGSSVSQTLASSVESNGSWQWSIPTTFAMGTDYKIRISSITTSTLRDESNASFSIGDKSELSIGTPNGGQIWEKERSYEIKWSDNLPGPVSIDLYRGASLYLPIAENIASNGTHTWLIPDSIQSGTTYKIRITSKDKSFLYDTSDAPFSINNRVLSIPYTQNFQTFDTGTVPLRANWEQVDDDDLDWAITQGATPSRVGSAPNVTGPKTDHTSGNASGKYMYIEASQPNFPSKEAHMLSPLFTLADVTSAQMSFYYHMYSDSNHMGTLNVDIKEETENNWKDGIIAITGNQGDQWKLATFNLQDYIGKSIQFRFRGVTGSSWASDICIDDFVISGATGVIASVMLPSSYGMWIDGSRLTYSLPVTHRETPDVSIVLFSLQGKLIRTFAYGKKLPGMYFENLDASGNTVAPGVYLCSMKAGAYASTLRVTIKE